MSNNIQVNLHRVKSRCGSARNYNISFLGTDIYINDKKTKEMSIANDSSVSFVLAPTENNVTLSVIMDDFYTISHLIKKEVKIPLEKLQDTKAEPINIEIRTKKIWKHILFFGLYGSLGEIEIWMDGELLG